MPHEVIDFILGCLVCAVGWLGKRLIAGFDSSLAELSSRVKHLEDAAIRRARAGQ